MTPQLQFMFSQAVQAFQAGNFAQAEHTLNSLMRATPEHFDTTHLLAIVCASQDQHEKALTFYQKALQINPRHAQALSNQSASFNTLGRNLEALEAIKKALVIDSQALQYWYNGGNILCDLGQSEQALAYYEKAIALDPQSYQAYNNYGKALFDLERYAQALAAYDQALTIYPQFIDCLINKGAALNKLKNYESALAIYEQVLTLKPDCAEAWSNKGDILFDLRSLHEALLQYDQAIILKPDYAEAWFNRANTFNALKNFDQALIEYDRAIELKPEYAQAWANRGNLLQDLKRYQEAIFSYEQALLLKPDIDWVAGALLHAKMKICDWNEVDENLGKLFSDIEQTKKVAEPFSLSSLSDDGNLLKLCSEIYTSEKFPFNTALGKLFKYEKKKIRIAYFSADFRTHPVASLTAELFSLHDRNHFDVIGFSVHKAPQNDVMYERIKNSFDQFIDVNLMSPQEIACLAREMEIDIAIDLGGHTAAGPIAVMAYRAAPIQVNYLGYPGTMGIDYIDYIIADNVLIPSENRSHYTEKVVTLPNSYQVNDRNRVISDKQFTREELGLPKNGFVFCCFNNNFKILPATFDSWMSILNTVNDSVIWLLEDNIAVSKNLQKEAEKRGIDSNRLVFAKRLPMPEHLARQRYADLFIDTLPYNAHTTSSDALWAGLPVLTLIGKSFAGRVAASLLNAIGLPELITTTPEEYENLAIELARNPQKLSEIKQKLENNRLKTPLFDTPLFTRNLETAYFKMFELHQVGLETEHIVLA
ncbi:tetratricopeptide repeat protein [Polynucleobacter paneuropaeus]|nr:tetratricopeptide repeat protein [Polynucleobacter paneuropaeus]